MTLLPKPTFQSITSGLRKTISKLEKLTNQNNTKALDLSKKIADHHATISTLDTEAIRAGNTASKLRDLIGEPA